MSDTPNLYTSFENSVISESVKELVKGIAKKIISCIKVKDANKQTTNNQNSEFNLESAILSLFNSMYNWSEYIEFVGIADPVELSTISLD